MEVFLNGASPKASQKRQRMTTDQRREAILKAGLDIFAAEGFNAAKLDTVAQRAGVAKGTIYVHFKDKQDLFEQIILEAVSPIITRLESITDLPEVPTAVLLATVYQDFQTDILETEKKHIICLVLKEGANFPAIATFYHREVITKVTAVLNTVIERALNRGEALSSAVRNFPHLIIAPLILSLIWDDLFAEIDPLDVGALLEAHQKLLMPDSG